MIRTQVSLDEREYELAKNEARQLGISVPELIRRAVRQMLPPADKPWMRYAGIVESGDPNSSQNIDRAHSPVGVEKAKALRAWANSFPDDLPVLSLDDVSRENIYGRD
jgi:hypothetical protein